MNHNNTKTKQDPIMRLATFGPFKSLLVLAVVTITFCAIDTFATSLYWRHLAIKHNAATYEANSWGIPSFHWNDTSFAQTPFQEEGWQKIQDAVFQKKLNQLGIK
jgi:hypothetical protein